MTAPSASSPFHILVLPGDGIGQEVVPAALRVLQATGLPFAFTQGEAGWACFEQHGTSLPDKTLAAAQAADAILFGAVSSPSHAVAGYRSPIVALRRALDLYANIRPVTTQPTTDHRPPTTDQQAHTSVVRRPSSVVDQPTTDHRPPTTDQQAHTSVVRRPSSVVDLVVVRENTEGLYAGRERVEDGGDTAIAERVITRRASERIVRAAFELAKQRGLERESSISQPKVTIVHKANVLRVSDGLFREAALHVAKEYPDIAVDELLVDNAALQLVQKPERFDVLVTTNMFGDILSDIASYWGGGLGMAASANIGDRQALFEPVHGSAPDIAGQGIANPLAAIGCAALLLDYFGRQQIMHGGPSVAASDDRMLSKQCITWASAIRVAMQATTAAGVCTPDLGGSASTGEVTDAIIQALL